MPFPRVEGGAHERRNARGAPPGEDLAVCPMAEVPEETAGARSQVVEKAASKEVAGGVMALRRRM